MSVQLSTVEIKAPKPCNVVLNPLHDWASSSYTWTLWWLGIDDYNNLQNAPDPDTALSYQLGQDSYVVAEDAGLYPDRRLPSTFGLNFNIQSVKFSTSVAQGQSVRHSNAVVGEMVVVEPVGLSLIDSLVAASINVNTKTIDNWTQHPYLLELNFKGWDDAGNPIPSKLSNIYKKRFPIKITSIKVSHASNKGTEYHMSFTSGGSEAWMPEYGVTPCDLNVVAGTVNDFFDPTLKNSFTSQLNDYFQSTVNNGNGPAAYADSYNFDIDPTIAQSAIVYDKQATFAQSGGNGTTLDLKTKTFQIQAKTPIVDVITRVMAQCDYLIQNQLQLETGNTTKDQTTIFNAFRTVASTTYAGVDKSGVEQPSVFDWKRNQFAKKITYKIHQFSTWDSNHPAIPLFTDSFPYSCKEYNYLYTGQNLDVMKMELDFSMTYFTQALSFTDIFPSGLVTSDSGQDAVLSALGGANLNPAILSRLVPQIGTVFSVSPMRVQPTVNDPTITRGFGILNNPAAQVGADVLKALYTKESGQMVKVDLTIVGDPTLIKQDDWLYIPSPSDKTADANYAALPQDQFMIRYGHARMDTGDVPVIFNINSTLDNDTEYAGGNQGLAFPNPATSSSASIFSGQYKIVTIDNIFERGVFSQILHLTRYINGDYVTAYKQSTNALRSSVSVDINQLNQLNTSSTNGATVGGTGTTIPNGR